MVLGHPCERVVPHPGFFLLTSAHFQEKHLISGDIFSKLWIGLAAIFIEQVFEVELTFLRQKMFKK